MRCFITGCRSHMIASSEMENCCYRLWVSMRAPLRKWTMLCFEQEYCMEKYNALGQWTLYFAIELKATNPWGLSFKQIYVPGHRIDSNICAISPKLGFRIFYMRTQSRLSRISWTWVWQWFGVLPNYVAGNSFIYDGEIVLSKTFFINALALFYLIHICWIIIISQIVYRKVWVSTRMTKRVSFT